MFRVRVPAGFRVKIAAREPIVLGYMEDGVRKEHTVWHPDDPVLFPQALVAGTDNTTSPIFGDCGVDKPSSPPDAPRCAHKGEGLMLKLEFASVTTMAFRATDNAFVIRGQSTKGKAVEAEFPLNVFARMSAETLRAAQVQDRMSAGHRENKGRWAEIVPIDIRTADIGVLEMETPPAVALVFDRGQATELSYRLTTEVAMNIGKRLVAASEQSKSTAGSSNN